MAKKHPPGPTVPAYDYRGAFPIDAANIIPALDVMTADADAVLIEARKYPSFDMFTRSDGTAVDAAKILRTVGEQLVAELGPYKPRERKLITLGFYAGAAWRTMEDGGLIDKGETFAAAPKSGGDGTKKLYESIRADIDRQLKEWIAKNEYSEDAVDFVAKVNKGKRGYSRDAVMKRFGLIPNRK